MKLPSGYWTKEKCAEEALKYESRKDFSNKSKSSYTISQRNGWLDDICYHMIKKPSYYWTKEKCAEEALKYKTRTEFKNNSYYAYKYSQINCWFDDICAHMPTIGNMYKRCIYAFEFTDNHVYIGLTYNINKRSKEHYKNSKSQVFKHIKNNQIQPNLVKLSSYIDVETAKILEANFIEEYKNKGWNILNIQKAGNVGGRKKSDENHCINIINNYTSLSKFRREQPNLYKSILRYKWNYLLDNLERSCKKNGFWTKEKCYEISIKYQRKIDFFKNSPTPYNLSRRYGWLEEICAHMTK